MKFITIGFLLTSFIITAIKLNYSAAAGWFLALLFYLLYLDELKKSKQLQTRISKSTTEHMFSLKLIVTLLEHIRKLKTTQHEN